jgi:LmbE family N-acetylglucosaminyl deacetylase
LQEQPATRLNGTHQELYSFIEALNLNMDDSIAIFISPHLDDAILSCGGTIHRLAAQGVKVLIATVFTADFTGHDPLSDLAQTNLRVWGLGNRPFAKRCEEDRLAAKHLGAEIAHLGFQDCIYRRDIDGKFLYSERVVDVQVHPCDWINLEPALEKALGALLRQYTGRDVRVFCPLGLGAHVDHVLVRHAVERVSAEREVLYYEEIPYVLRSNVDAGQTQTMSPDMVAISDADLQARLNASACYVSQIPGLFPSSWEIYRQIADARLPISRKIYPIRYNVPASMQRMNASINRYSKAIGGERYWTVNAQPIVLEGHGS